MKRTLLAHQPAFVAAGARPCVSAYERQWVIGLMNKTPNAFGNTRTTALGGHPI